MNYFSWFYKRDLPIFHNLFIQQFILSWTHKYLFYTLCYSPVLIYFICHIIPALAIENSFSWPCFPLSFPHYCAFRSVIFFFIFSRRPFYSGTKIFFSPILYILYPVLESVISPKSSVPFNWRVTLETKIRALDMLFWCGIAPKSSWLTEQDKVLIPTLTFTHSYQCNY